MNENWMDRESKSWRSSWKLRMRRSRRWTRGSCAQSHNRKQEIEGPGKDASPSSRNIRYRLKHLCPLTPLAPHPRQSPPLLPPRWSVDICRHHGYGSYEQRYTSPHAGAWLLHLTRRVVPGERRLHRPRQRRRFPQQRWDVKVTHLTRTRLPAHTTSEWGYRHMSLRRE